MKKLHLVFIGFFGLILFLTSSKSYAWQQNLITKLKGGSICVVDDAGRNILSHKANRPLIPASILKVATAYAALDRWGKNHRFLTEFWLTKDKKLIIKGFGDPFWVSEEITKLAKQLNMATNGQINEIILDDSYFSPGIIVDGSGTSSNPYSAINGALIANFNSAYLQKNKNGTFQSAEPQTPLTATTRKLVKSLPKGKHRINIGTNSSQNAVYFGELLAKFLQTEGIQIQKIQRGQLKNYKAKKLFDFRSNSTLEKLVKDLLEYSNNFMSNQLFLILGAEAYGPPATIAKGQKYLRWFLRENLAGDSWQVYEGAGLSRQNRVSCNDMLVLLDRFEPYLTLLPKRKKFYAKTGTLSVANTYAGFVFLPSGQRLRFAILVNSKVPYNYKFELADLLYMGLTR